MADTHINAYKSELVDAELELTHAKNRVAELKQNIKDKDAEQEQAPSTPAEKPAAKNKQTDTKPSKNEAKIEKDNELVAREVAANARKDSIETTGPAQTASANDAKKGKK